MRPNQNAPVLLFTASGIRFGVFVAEVSKIRNDAAVVPVPFAHPALVGLLDAPDSDAVPVFELSAHAEAGAARIEVALFDTEQGPVGIRLEAVLGARADYDIITAPAAVAEACSALPPELAPIVTTLGQVGGAPFLFFSPEAFLGRLDLARAARPDDEGGNSGE